jgi:hypothetical protein
MQAVAKKYEFIEKIKAQVVAQAELQNEVLGEELYQAIPTKFAVRHPLPPRMLNLAQGLAHDSERGSALLGNM